MEEANSTTKDCIGQMDGEFTDDPLEPTASEEAPRSSIS
jgi:hypothetical protein